MTEYRELLLCVHTSRVVRRNPAPDGGRLKLVNAVILYVKHQIVEEVAVDVAGLRLSKCFELKSGAPQGCLPQVRWK